MAVQRSMVQVGELHGVAKLVWCGVHNFGGNQGLSHCVGVVDGSGTWRLALLSNRQRRVG